ncbi:hypothetical protein H7K45_18210 [Mycobacterium yunnanensis]|uniref:Uncharacterized protein n=1 Tax=Mycobacterium yunnanensis TaxID=368477 RepID=A0A9X2Z4P3_9MYCO|nr:hypothetical protein [Mycobacterium yunnanensis]MCV7422484.1 hypothetical protein [Mycobacterium yunnanensis]
MAATTGSRTARPRLVASVLFLATAWALGSAGVAHASPVFDVDSYAQCTSTTVPAPGQDADAVISQCCVQNAGVPAPTRFGMGCAAPLRADADPDERPLIVLPSRALPDDEPDADLGGLVDAPLPEPLP